jgi:DNA primase
VPEFQEFPVPRHSDTTKAAIKNAVDIVALVGEYLPLRRAGSKFKALCPFHDDHHPSLELNPERQSFKCWSCGAGGDVFDFVQGYEHVAFPEALRMLAERAGIMLESPSTAISPSAQRPGPLKSDLLAVLAWAEQAFRKALVKSDQAIAYVRGRGLTPASIERFRLGHAPAEAGWLPAEGRKQGFSTELLEQAGLVSRPEDSSGLIRERFRGRLIFPIHDERGRTIGFGGRILPEVERALAARGKNVAKYLNSPETTLFQKRKVLYAADLARAASREAGWVAVVEGYTDVIAAHQAGIWNVVGTLGTALGGDHVQGLKRLVGLEGHVLLVFDGDAAGQSAADRALELFLEHDLDLRVLSLPANLDPCDFLLKEGAGPFLALVKQARDPLAFVLQRAGDRFDFGSIEQARRAADWVLGILSRLPSAKRTGTDDRDSRNIKLNKAIDALAHGLKLPVEQLKKRLREICRTSDRPGVSHVPPAGEPRLPGRAPAGPIPGSARPAVLPPPREMDPLERELVAIVVNQPEAAGQLVSRVALSTLSGEISRTIFKVCYELYREDHEVTFDRIMARLDDPEARAVAEELHHLALGMADPQPLEEGTSPPAPWQARLDLTLVRLAERERQLRIRQLLRAMEETGEDANPEAYRALQLEYQRLLTQRATANPKRSDPSLRA